MFKYVFSFFWKTNTQAEESLPVNQAYDVADEDETSSEEETDIIFEDEPEQNELFKNYEVCNKIGTITKIFDDASYLIDGIYKFKSEKPNFSIGATVSYKIIKPLDAIKVLDVNVIDNHWNVVETGKKVWHSRTLICKVEDRNGRDLILSPGNILVNLNEVPTEFIPIRGDWVELLVKCEIDENVIDLSGKILEITKLLPLRPQMKQGIVTSWKLRESHGSIDGNIFFNKDVLHCGYIPAVGDRVVVEIIESNQERCSWRALKVLPDYVHNKNSYKKIEALNEDDFRESHDGLTVSKSILLTFTRLGEIKFFSFEVESKEEIMLVCIEFPNISGQCKLVGEIDHCILKPNCPLTIRCECTARNIGESEESIIFHFNDFKMRRQICTRVNSCAPAPSNVRRYYRNNKRKYKAWGYRELVPGEQLYSPSRFTNEKVPHYAVPEELLNFMIKHHSSDPSIFKNELERMYPSFTNSLNYMNYENKFHNLLYLDEIAAIIEKQNYDQDRACFTKCGDYLLLEIENLAEKQPSVVLSDRVIARNIHNLDLDTAKNPDYEGCIHKISKNHIYIKFSQRFHDTYDGEDYSIRIVGTRATYRREHHAVFLAMQNLGKDWLFPTKIIEREPQVEFNFDSYSEKLNDNDEILITEPNNSAMGKERILKKISQFKENKEAEIRVPKLEWYNKSLNFYQKEAVRNILLGVCRPMPYIIFGPPGTGKTVTIVETILQILRLMPRSRILVSAPSNSASDLLALRLVESDVLQPGDLVRLVAITHIELVPPKLAPYCATGNPDRDGTETDKPTVTKDGMVLGYNSEAIGRHRITVCTCSTAGLLVQMGFSQGHFSHVIVDEAGQTKEPSVLIPLSFVDLSSGQAIMAGDPMQLGPVILSKLSAEYGLEESLLERLINRFPYTRDIEGFPKSCGYDPRLVTKLVYNYRSLPDILKLPSLLFYNDELIATKVTDDCPEAELLAILKGVVPLNKEGKISSMVFHGVDGTNYQPEDSPSWFNPNEASQVFFYVNELYGKGLIPDDIGIISPYKAQTRELYRLFREADFKPPKIGTVEEYQGQEYNVIILSTVRSSVHHVESDIRYSIGFVSNPRRVNVSITRAKSLLIIVGNPNLLAVDKCWRSVINYCVEKGSFVGSLK